MSDKKEKVKIKSITVKLLDAFVNEDGPVVHIEMTVDPPKFGGPFRQYITNNSQFQLKFEE